MKKVVVINLLISLFLLFVSCNQNTDNALENSLNVKVSAVSKNNGDIEFCVYPENQYGMIANGASVCVEDSSNSVTILPFNNTSQCFTDTVDSLSENFKIKVKSALSKEIVTVEVPHKKIQKKPALTSFSDQSGNNMLAAEKINITENAVLAWESSGEGITYIITVSTSSVTVFSKATNALYMEIPSGTLEAGKIYYLKITTQKIEGDPLYENCNYYSVSEYAGSSISFNTAE